ncbi:MAG TPA: GNAT family N-acetyltransferase [Candidatus Polarisedimenticolaceae bacterium]|nr:GNAT family N-acetyltransferase [Candidatus Polarisedimenticolaceae bacterium]
MTEFEIRPARRDDLPQASLLAAELVRLHHGFDALRFMIFEPIAPGYERFMASLLGRKDAVVLVAIQDGSVVGYLIATLEDRDWSDLRDACGKIHDVYVAEGARGKGIASALCREALERMAAMGAPRVVLMTAWQNEGARKLFGALGFRPTMVEMTRESESPTRRS